MAHIVLLALAAAVFPTLIACVAIMISRPEPRRLLLAFYAGALIVSVTAGIVVLDAFNKFPADHAGAFASTLPTWRQVTRSVDRKTGKIGAHEALVALA